MCVCMYKYEYVRVCICISGYTFIRVCIYTCAWLRLLDLYEIYLMLYLLFYEGLLSFEIIYMEGDGSKCYRIANEIGKLH